MYTRMLYILCCISIYAAHANQYILQLQPHESSSQAPQLRAYYKGNRLDISDPSFCRLPESRTVSAFAVIIADDIQFERDSRGVITFIQRPHERSIRWFDVTYHNDDMQQPWHVCERNHDDIPTRVPENTIYLMANPDMIENLSVQQMKGTTYIALEYNEHNTETGHEAKTVRALMASLDAEHFHTQTPQRVVRQDHNRYVTTSMLCRLP